LKGIKEHAPNKEEIPAFYVEEYHTIIDSLEKETSLSLSEFRIPWNEITFGFSSHNTCPKGIFMSKVDALLSYFELTYPSEEEKTEIGFKPPKKEKK